MKQFIVVGDYIHSRGDGDRHFISAHRLCELYQLDPLDCILVPDGDRVAWHRLPNLPRLYPRYHGDYLEHLQRVRRGKEKK
jgi:hypothetical protein